MPPKRKQPKPKPLQIVSRRTQTRPIPLRSFPVLPEGPELYQQAEGIGLHSGPGEPPAGFLTYTNSATEWMVYWALAKIIGQPKDPRQPPYIGWPGAWTYQRPFEGGRHTAGGQVVDFLVYHPATSSGAIALRIQTERFHIMTDAAKQAKDRALLIRLSGQFRVVDLYEQDFVNDPSGQAVVIETKRALYGGSTSNPIRTGRARRIRNAR